MNLHQVATSEVEQWSQLLNTRASSFSNGHCGIIHWFVKSYLTSRTKKNIRKLQKLPQKVSSASVTEERPTGSRAAGFAKENKIAMLEKCQEVKHTIQAERNKSAVTGKQGTGVQF